MSSNRDLDAIGDRILNDKKETTLKDSGVAIATKPKNKREKRDKVRKMSVSISMPSHLKDIIQSFLKDEYGETLSSFVVSSVKKELISRGADKEDI